MFCILLLFTSVLYIRSLFYSGIYCILIFKINKKFFRFSWFCSPSYLSNLCAIHWVLIEISTFQISRLAFFPLILVSWVMQFYFCSCSVCFFINLSGFMYNNHTHTHTHKKLNSQIGNIPLFFKIIYSILVLFEFVFVAHVP